MSNPRPLIVLFTSPKAGSGRYHDQPDRLAGLLRDAGHRCEKTHDVAELNRLLREDRPRVVVAAGGDGTIGLAASHLASHRVGDPAKQGGEHPTRLIPMPLGTENLLARHYGFRADAAFVFDIIENGNPEPMDLGIVGGRPFLSMVTCGFDGEVVRAMHLTRRGHIRRFDYWRPIVRALRKYPFPEITIDAVGVDGDASATRTLKCGWAMAFNLPCYAGGLSIEPHAIGNDGLIDVVAFEGRSIASGLRYVAGIRMGWHLSFPDIIRFRARSIHVHCESRVPFQRDGDYGGRLPIEISVQPAAIELLRLRAPSVA